MLTSTENFKSPPPPLFAILYISHKLALVAGHCGLTKAEIAFQRNDKKIQELSFIITEIYNNLT